MRFFSPSVLLLSLFALPMPWLDIRFGSIVLTRQSGIEALGGKVSTALPAEDKDLTDEDFSGLLFPLLAEGFPGVTPWMRAQNTERAVLAIGWLVLVVVGVALGFGLRASRRRSLLMGLLAVSASACLIAQAFVARFPLIQTFEKHEKPRPTLESRLQEEVEGKRQPTRAEKRRPKLEAFLGPGLWLGLLFPLCAALCALAETGARRRDYAEEEGVLLTSTPAVVESPIPEPALVADQTPLPPATAPEPSQPPVAEGSSARPLSNQTNETSRPAESLRPSEPPPAGEA